MVKLSPTTTISGRVIDQEGDPVSGANLSYQLKTTMETGGMHHGSGGFPTSTDFDGLFAVDAPLKGKITISASKQNFRPASSEEFTLEAGREFTDLELVLVQRKSLRDILVDQEGEPLTNWQINIQSRKAGSQSSAGYGYTNSGFKGTFTIDGADEENRLTFHNYNVNPYGQQLQYASEWFPHSDDEIVFSLPLDNGVTGRVVDAATGEPIENFDASLNWDHQAQSRQLNEPQGTECKPSRTYAYDSRPNKPEGRFEFRGVREGPYRLSLSGKAIIQKTLNDIKVSASKLTDLGYIPIEMGLTLTSRLIDASTGEPIKQKRWGNWVTGFSFQVRI